MTKVYASERNRKIAEKSKETRQRRTVQECKTFALKITHNKLKTTQKEALTRSFLEAKWYKNHILNEENINKISTKKLSSVPVKTKEGIFENRELNYLGSHQQQSILQQTKNDLKGLSALKKKGKRVGKLKYCKQINSIDLKQYGTTYKFNNSFTKVKISGLPGWYRFNGGQQLTGYEIANAKLVQKPSGYYLIVTCFKNKKEIEKTYQSGTEIGIDMGVKTHITLSNGEKINTLIGETERLKRLQKKSSRQVKGSNNYRKTLHLINKQYEKMGNKKNNNANKLVHKLLKYETIYLQDESLSAWRSKHGYAKSGKRLQHSILGRVKAKLAAHERVVVLPKWVATTQSCRGENCKKLNKHGLNDRVYSCNSCGYSFDRDVHAALNMVSLGTDFKEPLPAGCGDVKLVEIV